MLASVHHSILVVHRDQAIRRRLAGDLRAAGFGVVEADTGAKALELAEHFSALLIGVDLADVDGDEVCRLLRARVATAHLPIVRLARAPAATEADAWSADIHVLPHVDGPVAPLFASLLGAARQADDRLALGPAS